MWLGEELTLCGVLHALGLSHCIFTLSILMMDNFEITFKKLYCIFKKDRFYIKSKFTVSFSHSSKLFRFSAPFSIISAELNAAFIQISTTQKFSPKLMENQISL